ncbi:hypothetical protein Pcinc_018709 [Petrolisthes cinctipes]|uniref:Uncharacterized protein n=1 Tax=Petrolisthes cinctipes TaxID=88211 RepID=A0AAE1KM51_PETCI|nr:hypothetical protein Pcinc_018709 [Petrolisthes cinctipes]
MYAQVVLVLVGVAAVFGEKPAPVYSYSPPQTVNYYVNGDSGFVADVTYQGEARYPESQESYEAPQRYTPPQPQRYAPPQPTYSSSESVESEEITIFAPRPQPSYTPPQPTYAPPRPTYAPPQPTYAPPQPTYAPPRPTYAPPQPTYAPPQPTYAPPRRTYGFPGKK